MSATLSPLFITSRESLTDSLRLTEISDSVRAQVGDALMETRIYLYDKLGATRVAEILAYASVEAPAATNELTRKKAEILEFKLVYLKLLRVSNVFLLNTAGTQDTWNENGVTRLQEDDRDKLIKSLEAEIFQLLDTLNGDTTEEIASYVLGPTDINKYPGDRFVDGTL